MVLDDARHGRFGPNHEFQCELSEINGGAMDGFVTGKSGCANAENFALASTTGPVAPYHELAREGALADRYFQPVVGGSASNDLYLAAAKFVFDDNEVRSTAIGASCTDQGASPLTLQDPSIGDLLDRCGVPWTFYIGGYQATLDAIANDECPAADPQCPVHRASYPCVYDPQDVPFQYYGTLQDDPGHFRDLRTFFSDVAANELPAISYLKQIGFLSEHSGSQVDISSGVSAVQEAIDAIRQSPTYRDDTLILLTYDESGGYFDHVAPPSTSTVDCLPYGARVPLLALGRFARSNYIAHATLEHSSIVKFIEWNWFDGQTGQLGARDAVVNNIGALLDASATGTSVPRGR